MLEDIKEWLRDNFVGFIALGLSIIVLSSIVLTLADIMGYCNWFIEAEIVVYGTLFLIGFIIMLIKTRNSKKEEKKTIYAEETEEKVEENGSFEKEKKDYTKLKGFLILLGISMITLGILVGYFAYVEHQTLQEIIYII